MLCIVCYHTCPQVFACSVHPTCTPSHVVPSMQVDGSWDGSTEEFVLMLFEDLPEPKTKDLEKYAVAEGTKVQSVPPDAPQQTRPVVRSMSACVPSCALADRLTRGASVSASSVCRYRLTSWQAETRPRPRLATSLCIRSVRSQLGHWSRFTRH